MQLDVKGKNLEVSDSIRSYAERKLAKLDKQLHALTRVEVELAVEKNPSVAANQIAEATVWLKGRTLRAREASRDMKASIDELTEKLLRQVRDEGDKKTSKRKIDMHALDADGVEASRCTSASRVKAGSSRNRPHQRRRSGRSPA
jgi:putative sigma-54 modulation protein